MKTATMMKAAVVRESGQIPVYENFTVPISNSGENHIRVMAAALSHLVKSRANGTHYSASQQLPFIVGIDGVGRLDDGRRVYFVMPTAPYGSMAERTIVPTSHCISLPDDLDDVTAAAIVNPGMSSWAAYTERAKLQAGETVLINGATGIAGRLAIQIAKHLGAKKVIATGRNLDALKELADLGADVCIPLTEDLAALEAAFKVQFAAGVDVVIDYLWGKSAECLLIAGAKAAKSAVPIRFVQVGSVSGAEIELPSAVLRSSAITLMGSGMGSISLERLLHVMSNLLKAAVPAGLKIKTKSLPLADIQQVWVKDDGAGRTVFTITESEV